MKQRYVLIYRMLDGVSLTTRCFYCEEEALAVMENMEYANERDLIAIIDVENPSRNMKC